jgi:hypothetical protein
MGNAGVLAELFILGRVGEGLRGGGCGNALGLGTSSGVVFAVEGSWIGRPRESPLDSVSPRIRGGTGTLVDALSRSARVHLAAASVAGATEKRRPIWTVALLSVLRLRS